jgi:CRP/FNR family cyclic AMP-dependent transcriptional regulator
MFWTKDTPQDFMPKRVIDALKANFNEHELVQVSRFATPVDIAAGTTLTIEGTSGRQALVMVQGSASVIRNGEKVATIKAGELIGEIALLTGEPRTATVIADVDATVYALSPRDFASLLANCPRLEKRVASMAVHRLTAA